MKTKQLLNFDIRSFDKIKTIIREISSTYVNYKQLNTYELSELYSPFIEKSIVQYIKSHLYRKKVYIINSNINITIYSCEQLSYEFELCVLLHIVSTILLTLHVFGKSTEHTELNIVYIDIDQPKYLNKIVHTENDIESGCIGRNINSGSTVVSTGNIKIWRRSELVRTLIHELIHSLCLDLKNTNIVECFTAHVTKVNGTINRFLYGFNFNEVYTEFITLHIYAIWRAYMDNTSVQHQFNQLIKSSVHQMNVLLNHLNKYNVKCSLHNSNIMSYIYLKTIIAKSKKMRNIMYKLIDVNGNNSIDDLICQLIDWIEPIVNNTFEHIFTNDKTFDYTSFMFYD